MNSTSINYLKVSMFVIFTFLTMMIYSGLAPAGDYKMQTNLDEIADQMARWSKQCSTGKLTSEAQTKLSELLLETSQVLKELAGKGVGEMHMEHHNKIKMMKKAWDPFDTSDRM